MLASLLALHTRRGVLSAGAAGLLIGISAGFHPNAFIIAWPAALFLLGSIILKKRSAPEGAVFLLTAALTAGIFVWLSFRFNPNFIHDYISYGRPLGVADAPDIKILRWPRYYEKIFHRLGGTYYLPDIRWQYYSLPVLLLLQLLPDARKGIIPAGLIGFNLGLLILGKYSQPSLIFLLPFYYLAGAIGLAALRRNMGPVYLPLMLILILPTFFFTGRQVLGELDTEKESFRDYQEKVEEFLPPESRVLGSLSLEFLLEDGNLFHWRNLAELPRESAPQIKAPEKAATGTASPFSSYIRDRDIGYIVVPAEIPYIYESRPTWNVLYGNPAVWYPGMVRFIEEDCDVVASFDSPAYGTRIAAYRYARQWPVRIYRVRPEDSSRE